MPIDTSIYGMLQQPKPMPGPLDRFAQGLQVSNMLDQQDTGCLQRQQIEQQIANEPAARAMAEAERMQKLIEQDDKLVKSFSEQTSKELPTLTPETWGRWRAVQAERINMLGSPQYRQAAAQALQQVPEQFDPNWIKSKIAGATPAPAGHTRLPGGNLSPIDPEYLRGQEAIRNAGKSDTNVNVKVDTKTGESLAKPIGEMVQGTKDTALAAIDQIDAANRISEALDSGNVIVGPGADQRLFIAQLGNALGVGGKDDEETLVNTRNIIKGLAEFTLSARKQLKGQGQVSDFESRLIERASSGDVSSMTVPEIRTLVSVSDRLARKAYSLHEKNLQNLRGGAHKELAPFYEVPGLPAARVVAPALGTPATSPQFTPAEIDAELRRRKITR